MSDFNYLHTNCFEITVELGCVKFPPEEVLYGLWQHNKEPLLNFLEMVSPAHWKLPMVQIESSYTLRLRPPGCVWDSVEASVGDFSDHPFKTGASKPYISLPTHPGKHDCQREHGGLAVFWGCWKSGGGCWPASKPWGLSGSSR